MEAEMVEGFWIVQFEGMQGSGGGVAVLMKGQILGGDSGYTYTGSYKLNEKSIRARVSVRNFLPGVPSLLGTVGDFELDVTGNIDGDVIRGSASLVNPPGIGIALKLTKRANLPA
jgi:hypothetical protein